MTSNTKLTMDELVQQGKPIPFMERIHSLVMDELDQAGRRTKFFNDPVAWTEYMLGWHLWSRQEDVALSVVENKNTAVKAAHGVGKDVALDTLIPTPDGWTTMGQVQPGDTIFDEAGNPTRVTFKSQVYNHDCFRITFSDGAQVVAGREHQWQTIDFRAAGRARKHALSKGGGVTDWREHWDVSSTVTTQDMIDTLTHPNGKHVARNHNIPLNGALQAPEQVLPIDPYVLGVWLGDGSKSSGHITLGERKTHLPQLVRDAGYDFQETFNEQKNYFEGTIKGLVTELKELGLINNKHIPDAYLRASVGQRQALLRGLLDTDGFVVHDSTCGIDLMCERLALGVRELIVSLGIKCSWSKERTYLNGQDAGPRYRMVFNPQVSPFTPGSAKDEQWAPNEARTAKHTARWVVSIEQVESVPTQCIQVDSPRSMFLIGREMIPTHNTHLAGVLACWWIDTRFPNASVATTAPTFAQVNTGVWKHTRRIYNLIEQRYEAGLIDHKLPGYITSKAEWKHNGEVIGFGRKPKPGEEGDAIQGLHDWHVLAIGDEACGLSDELSNALLNITSNEKSRTLLVCNPTDPATFVGRVFRTDDPGWAKHTISLFDSPNFTKEKDAVLPDGTPKFSKQALESLTNRDYEVQYRNTYGVDSMIYKNRVLGEFTFSNQEQFFRDYYIQQCIDEEYKPDPIDDGQPVLGVDVSLSGGDSCVVFKKQGKALHLVDAWVPEVEDTAMDVVERIHEAAMNTGARQVRIDAAGLGKPLFHMLGAKADGFYDVVGMIGNAASPDPQQFLNARAAWYGQLRQDIENTAVVLHPDKMGKLHENLISIQYKFTQARNAVQIESKKDMRSRGESSPDYADAAVYANATLAGDDPSRNPSDELREQALLEELNKLDDRFYMEGTLAGLSRW